MVAVAFPNWFSTVNTYCPASSFWTFSTMNDNLPSASLNETLFSSRTLPPLNVKVTDGTGNAAKVRLAVVEVPAFMVRVSLKVESGVRLGATVFTKCMKRLRKMF